MTIQFNSNQVNYKTLSSSHQPQQANHKSLAGASQNPALAQWVEQNRYIYDAIVSGSSDLSQADEAQFMEWWNYAMSEMNAGSSSWGEDFGMDVVEEDGDMGDIASVDPFGAQEGPHNNLIVTEEEFRAGFIGEKRPYDVWSRKFTLDVSSMAAQVTVARTQDSRVKPPVDMIAVTVKDAATGLESVYYLHEATEININTPGGAKVTDNLGGNPAVTIGKYKKPSEADPNAAPESSLPAEEIDGKLVVEAPIGQTIELTPTANGEDQTWEVYGAYNMNLRPSDKVTVIRTGTNPDIFEIVVEHRNGDKDTYLTQPGSKGNINATPENVTFIDRTSTTGTKNVHGVDIVDVQDLTATDGTGTSAPAPEVKVPDGWENLTLNSGVDGGSLDELQGDEPTSMDGETRVYDGQDFDLYPVPSGSKEVAEVSASGTVSITPNSNSEYFEIYVEGNQFIINVFSKSPYTTENIKETIKIDADLVKTLDLTKIDYSRILNPVTLEDGIEDKYANKIQVRREDGEVGTPSQATWPIFELDHDKSRVLNEQIQWALSTKDWTEVNTYLAGLLADPNTANDTIRGLIDNLWVFLGKDAEKFNDVMDLIPADTRKAMISAIRANNGELTSEKGDDSGLSNLQIASMIFETIE